MNILILASALFCVGAGITIFIIKPRRLINQVFLVTSLLAGFWLACVWAAIRTGELSHDPIHAPVIWIRLNGMASLLWVWAISLLTHSITTDEADAPATQRRFSMWLLITLAITTIAFSGGYVRATASNEKGLLYYILASAMYAILIALVWRIIKQTKLQKGIRRVEMQFLALPLAVGSLAVLSLTILGNITGISLLKRLSFFPFILGYGLSAWAITFHRLYNPREILISLARIALIVGLCITTAYIFTRAMGPPLRQVDIVVATTLAFSITFWLEHQTRTWLNRRRDQLLRDLRNAVAAITRTETNPDRLISRFEEILQRQNRTAFATLLLDRDSTFTGKGVTLLKSRPACADLYEHRWATPESLARRRTTIETEDLRNFFAENSISALVAALRGNPTPCLLIALGEKSNGWPFTYPEVERMQNIVELMDNVLTHARLTAEAALKSRLEHLAMMSRGLAHDLKNLITPVDSFLVHTEPRIAPGTPEAEVHAAAKRSVAVMTDYIREALFFGNRLNPRFERVSIRELLQSSVDVTAGRAQRCRVHVSTSTEGMDVWRVDRVLVQRMLVNLLNNAIDACPGGGAVVITSAVSADGRLRIHVQDTGTGIAPEHLPRVFDPYFTTKQFGDDVRGFGLGLTICEKIARLHGGEISVASEVGHGTIFTVELPREPPMPPMEPDSSAGTLERPLQWRTAPSALPS